MEPSGLSVRSDALHGEKVGVGTLLVVAEYQRICNRSDVCFKDYKTYDDDFLAEIFGDEMMKEIQTENQNDSALGITAEILRENWEKVAFEVNKIPDIKWLESLYFDLEAKNKLSDIGVDDNMAAALLDCAPTVRNRLTLMRLRKCL